MRDAVFDVYGCLYGKRPEPITEVGINEEGTRHRCKGKVATFSDAVLVGSIGDGFFVGNACVLTVRCEFPLSEFRGVVDTKKGDFGTAKVFSNGMEICEMFKCFIARFHEIQSNVTRITTDKKNEVLETTVTGRQGAAYIGMNALEGTSCTMRRNLGERGSFNVGSSTNRTRGEAGVIEINALDSVSEPFNAYVTH